MTDKAEQSLQWIAKRRSVYPKEFNSKVLQAKDLQDLLVAAQYAPTHKLTEPWRFTVFMGNHKAQLAQLLCQQLIDDLGTGEAIENKSSKLREKIDKSSAVIAIIMKRDPQMRVPKDEELWSVACAVQNIQLHAMSMDIGILEHRLWCKQCYGEVIAEYQW